MPGGGDNLELALRIRADIGQAAKALQNVERDLAGLGAAGRKAEAGTTRAARGARRLSGATGRLGGKLRDVRGQINIFGFSAASAFGSLGAGIVSRAANAIVNLGASVVRAGTEMEAMDQRFRAATGSAAAAAAELEFVRAEIERLGLDALGAESGYSGLLAAMQGTALEGQATRDIFTAVAEAARVMGLSAAETGGVLTALEQIASKGTVSAEELRGQLGERLPGAFRIAARAMGVTTGELDGMLSAGELLADRVSVDQVDEQDEQRQENGENGRNAEPEYGDKEQGIPQGRVGFLFVGEEFPFGVIFVVIRTVSHEAI